MMEMVVAKWLRDAGFADVQVGTASVLDVAEPLVALDAGYERGARTRHAERGVFSVNVMAVRESACEAGAVALRCETAVRRVAWKAADATDGWVLCGVDTTVPKFNGYDGSGRAVFQFRVDMTCERNDG